MPALRSGEMKRGDGVESPAATEAARGGPDKRTYVRRAFEQIAPRYDLLNHLLSLNVDRLWRRRAVETLDWRRQPRGTYLDLCAGTMDLAAMLAGMPGFEGRIVAADFAEPMLLAGRGKATTGTVAPLVADAVCLPLRDGSLAGAIAAFGVRNLDDLDAGLREVRRVLEPGGRFVILDFATPRNRIVGALYGFYFNSVLPRIGSLISGHRDAYRYLPESVANFPSPEQLAERMRRAGFAAVSWRSLTFGIAAIHAGTRQ